MRLRSLVSRFLDVSSQWTSSYGWEPNRARVMFGESQKADMRRLILPSDWVIDIGANTGQTVSTLLELQPSLEVVAFEPAPKAFEVLERTFGGDPRVRLFNLAVGPPGGGALHITRESEGSSLLVPTSGREEAWLEVIDVKEVESVSLEQVMELAGGGRAASDRYGQCALLKIDTQGSDLAVLSSGEKVVSPERVRAVLVEMLFDSYYEGQGMAADTINFMMDRGFAPAAMYRPIRALEPKPLGWADMLFLPRMGRHESGKR